MESRRSPHRWRMTEAHIDEEAQENYRSHIDEERQKTTSMGAMLAESYDTEALAGKREIESRRGGITGYKGEERLLGHRGFGRRKGK